MFDGIIVSQIALEETTGRKLMCSPPGGLSGDQMANIVVKWIRDHPAGQHESGRMCAMVAFVKAYPCE